MADQPVTREKLINADIDVDNLGKAVNEMGFVNPRYGDTYKTLPQIAREYEENGATRGFKTLSEFDAVKAALPAHIVVTIGEAGPNQGQNFWDGVTLTKSTYDPLEQAKNYTNTKTNTALIDLIDLQEKSTLGGSHYYVSGASLFTFDGYVSSTGTFVSSTAGYKTTDFIPIAKGVVKSSLNASSSVSAISFYDANKQFISSLIGGGANTERTINVPSNAAFSRFTNLPANNPSPYAFGSFSGAINDPNLLKSSSLTVEKSLNLADPALIVSGAYVNSSGAITTAAGWKYIKIPVAAGETYTFGNFVIDSGGYYTFFNASGGQIGGANGNYTIGTLPKTVTAPVDAGFLLFDIARPTNTADQHAQLTINVGATLIAYVDPADTITKIAGKNLAGTGSDVPENVVVQDGNATLADVIADSLTTGALIANLPTSNVGLEVGQAYIDTASGTIKVVM